MATSDARILANRQNALKSTGPRTQEGKEQSSRNGLKHGLSGQGFALLEDDAAEVEQRDLAFQRELCPKTALGLILVRQMALLSVRMERAALHELAAVARNVRHAPDDFDENRLAAADLLLETIGENPTRNLRKLRRTPEGVDRLIEAWNDLRVDLTREPGSIWTPAHLDRAENLVGRRADHPIGSRLKPLSEILWGLAGESIEARAQARSRIIERIDTELRALQEHRKTIDLDLIAADRAEAGSLSLFDPSPEATLARRYESAAARGFTKALNEFRKVEAEAAALAETEPARESTPYASPALGSSRQGQPTPRQQPATAAPAASRTPETNEFATAKAADGRPVSIGRPDPARA
jgi:hypothetical protein